MLFSLINIFTDKFYELDFRLVEKVPIFLLKVIFQMILQIKHGDQVTLLNDILKLYWKQNQASIN